MVERVKNYLAETRVEMRKVTWPQVTELKESTRVVIIATILLTIFIGFVDQVLNRLVHLIVR